MNTKKILLPEGDFKGRNKTRKRKREETTELHQNSEGTFTTRPSRGKFTTLVTDQRQRNEATGLVMIGLSAFSLSLIHYISSSGIPGLINSTMVNLGIGVYIAPTLVGLMGAQKFLDRPFENLGWRIAGSVGTFLSSVILFHSEGGKLGSWLYTSFSGIFGGIPTYILFTAILLSSSIFALDILYKDVLGGVLILCSLLTRFAKFCWEVTLNLVSMSIGAVKTTASFCATSYDKICQTYNENQLNPESGLGKLLAFKPHISDNQLQDSENKELPSNIKETASDFNSTDNVVSINRSNVTENCEEEAQIIPVPKLFNQSLEQEEKKAEPQSVSASSVSTIHIANIASECVFVNSSISVIAVNSVPQQQESAVVSPTPSVQVEMPQEEVETTKPIKVIEEPKESISIDESQIFNQTEEEKPEKLSGRISLTEEDERTEQPLVQSKLHTEPDKSERINSSENTESSAKNTDSANNLETFVEKEQVYLEDNRIDQEIKAANAQQEPPANINKYALCKLPPLDILKVPPVKISNADIQSELSYRSAHLLKTLGEFGIKATITDIVQGPAVSRFELKPAPGVKVRQITSLTDDIALSLAAQSIAIEAPIPGKSALGIIIPNSKPTPVYFYNLLKDDQFTQSPNLLQVAVGVTINGTNIYTNLAEMPHLLIAGSTGSGKSVCVNSIIASILFRARADQVKFIMIDPKMVELSGYNGIPHLIAPVVTDPSKASGALMWAVEEMERRYELLSKCQGIKNIGTYNEKLEQLRQEVDPRLEPMPYIVIVIDELADLMMTCSAEVEGSICRLTQMARAVGMHLIIATQRPSVNVITGLIKANLPSRIAFSVSSQVDSKTILDAAGAEKLLGKGDMLFLPKGLTKPKRLQGPYVSDNELNDLIAFVKSQGKPEYLNIAISRNKDDDGEDDGEEEVDSDQSLIDSIKKYLSNQEKTSTSMLQRKFRIGYNRAARIMDQLEEEGIVSPSDGSKQRRVLNGRSNS